VIRASGLTKRFGARVALDAVSLEVQAGQAVAVIGPNGSGKTTLLRVLSTLGRPDSGSATVTGADLLREPERVRASTAVVLHHFMVYDDLTLEENLRFAAALRGLRLSDATVAERLRVFGLEARAHERAATLSRGNRQRFAITRAFLGAPRVLLLDEPLSGLDEEGRALAERAFTDFTARGGTILATGHRDRDAAFCARSLRLDRGALAAG